MTAAPGGSRCRFFRVSSKTRVECKKGGGGAVEIPRNFFGYNKGCKSHNLLIYTLISGKRGIRTLGTVTRTTVFETVPIDHSGIFP